MISPSKARAFASSIVTGNELRSTFRLPARWSFVEGSSRAPDRDQWSLVQRLESASFWFVVPALFP